MQFGYGWADVFNPTVSSLSAGAGAVRLVGAACQPVMFTGKDGSGNYLPAAGVLNSLTQHADNTWAETRPDQFQNRYDTGGLLKTMANPAGSRWSLTRTGNLITSILNPFGQKTSYSYDGSNNIRRITDAARNARV